MPETQAVKTIVTKVSDLANVLFTDMPRILYVFFVSQSSR
jgi:hypothetical protein